MCNSTAILSLLNLNINSLISLKTSLRTKTFYFNIIFSVQYWISEHRDLRLELLETHITSTIPPGTFPSVTLFYTLLLNFACKLLFLSRSIHTVGDPVNITQG